VKFSSPIISAGSGSWNGITVSHNRNGMYIRGRTNPVQPNSNRQTTAKGRFLALANDWSNVLTAVQRAAWNLYGNSVAWQPPFGDPVYLTGYNMFIRTNMAALAGGLTQVNDAPTTFTLAGGDAAFSASASEATQLLSIVFDDTLDWLDEDGGAMLIYQSQPKGAGRTFIGGPTRYAGAILGDSSTPPTTPTTIAVPYVVTELQRIEVLGRIVRADGRLSNHFRFTAAVGS